jgi:hypothetical protein
MLLCQLLHFYAHYANRVRGEGPSEEVVPKGHEQQPPKRHRYSPSWARLIAKVYQADPLVCGRCGGKLRIVAYVNDALAIRRILAHLGLSPPEVETPRSIREASRVPLDEEGREIEVG